LFFFVTTCIIDSVLDPKLFLGPQKHCK